MYEDLRGKVALVTGSGQGIGRGIALAFAENGVDVVINVRSRVDAAQEVAEEVRKRGARAFIQQADVADRDAVFKMVDNSLAEFGRIDFLVNNAASPKVKGLSFEALDYSVWLDFVNEILNATVHTCQAVGPHFMERLTGGVINITSMASVRPLPFWSGYSVVKQAVTMFTRELAMEWLQPEGSKLRVNAIAPGLIETPRTSGLFQNPPALAARLEAIPMRRAGTPQDIANVAMFLASDVSSFMTGQELLVDGGETDYWPIMAKAGLSGTFPPKH